MDKKRVVKFLLESEFIDWVCKRNRIISGVLIFFICVGLSYSFYLFLTAEKNIRKEVDNIEIFASRKTEDMKFPQLKSKSFYEAPLGNKDMFKGVVKKQEEESQDDSFEFVNQLQLKGIMSGRRAKAIIEHPSYNKTWLVGEGEKIKGVKVRDIKSGEVTLYYKGKYFTLNL